MPPKKKQQKLALVDFFAETPSGGSWADDDVALPSAPAKKEPGAQPSRGSGYLDSMPDRGPRSTMDSGFSGPPREELPVPTVPPFTAFVGNLTFETDDEAVKEHLGPGITSVRLVKDPMSGKPKGYGYVEFGSQGELKVALGKNMTSLGGRTIRVSVAEPPTGRSGAPSAAETASEWRRSGPIPAREAPQARRNDSFGGAPRDSDAGPPRDLDWGAARGAKFSPAPASNDFRRDSSGGVPREGREGRESTQFGSGLADGAREWRSNKPAAIAVEGRAGSGQSSPGLAPGLADTESTWTRASKLRTPIDTPPVSSPTGEETNRDWRGSRAPSAAASVAGDSPQAPVAPVERRKLNLAPRSQATGDAAPTSGSSSSIFGSAKPIDTTAREAETFAKRQEERKKAQEERAKALKEEDDKIKAEADARAKSITDARDAAIREAGGVPPAAPQAKKPQGQGQGPRQGPGGPGRQNSNGPHGHGHGQGQQNRPARGGRTNSNQAQKTEDGFEVARGSRRDNREEQAAAQAQAKKDAPVRKGFSFAAAAGLVEDTEGDDKEDESEDVSKRLAEVKV